MVGEGLGPTLLFRVARVYQAYRQDGVHASIPGGQEATAPRQAVDSPGLGQTAADGVEIGGRGMKIGLILERFDPGRGGLEQWCWRFAAGMLARGHEIHALAGSFSETVRRLPIVAHQLRAARGRLDFGRAAEETARGLDLDIIHDTGAGWYCDVFQPHGGSRFAAIEQNVRLLPPYMRPAKRTAARFLPRYREFAALMKRQYVDDGRVFLALSNRVAEDSSAAARCAAGADPRGAQRRGYGTLLTSTS